MRIPRSNQTGTSEESDSAKHRSGSSGRHRTDAIDQEKGVTLAYKDISTVESLRRIAPLIPVIPAATSYRLGWMGLQAVRYRDSFTSEFSAPPNSQHSLVLITRPPEEMDLRYEGVERNIPPPAGSIALIPAGSAALWRWRGSKDSLHIYLEPRLIARVAAASFELDSVRMVVPPWDRVGWLAGRTACFRTGSSKRLSSTSWRISTPVRRWSKWLRSSISAPITSLGNSKRRQGCRRIST